MRANRGLLVFVQSAEQGGAFKGAAFWQYIHSNQASLISPNVLLAPTFCLRLMSSEGCTCLMRARASETQACQEFTVSNR